MAPEARFSDGLAHAFCFSSQAEDAFLPVRAALNVETCQLQQSTTPAALPTSEMAWENRIPYGWTLTAPLRT